LVLVIMDPAALARAEDEHVEAEAADAEHIAQPLEAFGALAIEGGDGERRIGHRRSLRDRGNQAGARLSAPCA
jgi:hypothetical protein